MNRVAASSDRPIVLREKLRRPQPSGLARERVERLLLEQHHSTLDLVVAPAGSGKTTLLSRVADGAGMAVGWCRLTVDDTTEDALVAYLAHALEPVIGVDPGSVESLDQLLAAIDAWPAPHGLLVLDDLHEIAATPAELALERFVSLRPRKLHLIFGSRIVPDVNVPRLRVSGEVREIGSDDLRFRSWEVEELFATVYGEPLRPEAAALLTRRTEGWAAALQLFHLSTTGRSPAERHAAVGDLGGRSKLVRSYLTRNVLAKLPQSHREFLVRTCTLGRLSGTLCDDLLEATGSAAILVELEDRQLFTTTDDGRYFRYHQVLSSHLELALIEQLGEKAARSWYSRSAELLESAGHLRDAVRAYAKAEEWRSVSRIMRDDTGATPDPGFAAAPMPAAVWRQDPWLALAFAHRRVRAGELRAAADVYRDAMTMFDDPGFVARCHDEYGAVTLWLDGRSDGVAGRHWSAPLRWALTRGPDRPLPDLTTQSLPIRLSEGCSALVAGEFGRARQAFAAVTESVSPDPFLQIAATLGCCVLDVPDAAAVDSAARFGEVADRADHEGFDWIARLARGLQATALATVDAAPWRLATCAEMVRECDRAGDAWGAAVLTLSIAIARSVTGTGAQHDFRSAATRFAALDAPVLELWATALGAQSVEHGDLTNALDTSKRLRIPGARAVLSASLGRRDAPELAARCGFPLMWLPVSSVPGGHPVDPPAAVYCLGGFRLELGGVALDLTRLRPQARTLLRMLATSPNSDIHRETLEDQLWPGVAHSVASHRLQVAVSSIRGLFDGTCLALVRTDHSYRLSLPPGSVADVRDFRDVVAAAAAERDRAARTVLRREALKLYSGDLLPEEGPAEYVVEERDRLRRSAASTACALAVDYWECGDADNARIAARKAIDVDPYQDGPWDVLVRAYEAAGDMSAAESCRREHARVWADLDIVVP